MATQESTRLDDHERPLPIEQLRPKQQALTEGVAESAWSDAMVLVVGELLSQEQDLGGQSRPRL